MISDERGRRCVGPVILRGYGRYGTQPPPPPRLRRPTTAAVDIESRKILNYTYRDSRMLTNKLARWFFFFLHITTTSYSTLRVYHSQWFWKMFGYLHSFGKLSRARLSIAMFYTRNFEYRNTLRQTSVDG